MEPTSSAEMHPSRDFISEASSYILTALLFLLPVFVIPGVNMPAQFAKTMLIMTAVVILIILFALRMLKSRSVSLSFSLPLFATLALPLLYLASAAFSTSLSLSFFGYQIESDTLGFVLLGAALTVITMFSLSGRQISRAFIGLFTGAGVVLVFEVIQLFFGRMFGGSGIFSLPTINLVGSWNSLGVFAGLIVVLSLVALESFSFSKLRTALLYVALVLSIALLIVVNFNTVWALVAAVSFCVLVYSITRSFSKHMSGRGGGAAAAVIVFICALFFFFNGSLGQGASGTSAQSNIPLKIQDYFGIKTLEVRPSVQSTVAVISAVLAKSPLVGSGPNTFGQDWLLYRPTSIVATPFWDVAFPAGFGSIPTTAATGGVVVVLGWILLFGTVCFSAGRALLSLPEGESHQYFLAALSATGSLYLLFLHSLYVPEGVISLLMFVFIGMFLASLKGTRLSHDVSVSFVENPRLGFVSVLIGLVVAIGALAFLYEGSTVFASVMKSNQALQEASNGKFDAAHDAMVSAISLSGEDTYYRTLSAIELARINTLVQSGASGAPAQKQFSDLLTAAINAGSQALQVNPNSYANWLARASVYASVVPLKINGAYESAVADLNQARLRNPGSPEPDYRIAEMQAILGKGVDARKFAVAALAKKQDYTPAILLLAQLSLSEGKLADAIEAVNSATVLDPQNAQLLYQLGLLNLQAKRYDDARGSFEHALSISPEYANASFFLGQAYYFLGRQDDALKVLSALQVKNPDDKTLQGVLTELKAGKNPFPQNSPDSVNTPTK